jgi:hypothetical protein
MDSQGGALLPVAASFRLRASQARYGRNSVPEGGRGTCEQKSSDGAFCSWKKACLDCTLTSAPQGLTKTDLMGELGYLLALPAYQLALPFTHEAWRQLEYTHVLAGTTL